MSGNFTARVVWWGPAAQESIEDQTGAQAEPGGSRCRFPLVPGSSRGCSSSTICIPWSGCTVPPWRPPRSIRSPNHTAKQHTLCHADLHAHHLRHARASPDGCRCPRPRAPTLNKRTEPHAAAGHECVSPSRQVWATPEAPLPESGRERAVHARPRDQPTITHRLATRQIGSRSVGGV